MALSSTLADAAAAAWDGMKYTSSSCGAVLRVFAHPDSSSMAMKVAGMWRSKVMARKVFVNVSFSRAEIAMRTFGAYPLGTKIVPGKSDG